MDQRKLTRAALLLALTLLFQSVRFIIPVPPFFSTMIIGTLVNACLIVTLELVGFWPAAFIACVTPLVAYFQQLLPIPPLILPVACGNLLFVSLFFLLKKQFGQWAAVVGAAAGKAIFLYSAFTWMLTWLGVPSALASALLFVMSWPQLVTGIAGAILAGMVVRRLRATLS